MEVSMSAYLQGQVFADQRWGTRMPVSLMVASTYCEVRARGTYTVAVQDAQRLAEQIPDPDDLFGQLGAYFQMAITDLLGELSQKVSGVAQLTAVTPATVQAMQANLAPKFDEMGLKLQAVKIEAIESL
jgi:membrane protease subunit (stomatin/prohibitin family)